MSEYYSQKQLSKKRQKKLKYRTSDKCCVMCTCHYTKEPHYNYFHRGNPGIDTHRLKKIKNRENAVELQNESLIKKRENEYGGWNWECYSCSRYLRKKGHENHTHSIYRYNSKQYNKKKKKNRKAHRNYVCIKKQIRKKNMETYSKNDNCPICCENMKGKKIKPLNCCNKAMCATCYGDFMDHANTKSCLDIPLDEYRMLHNLERMFMWRNINMYNEKCPLCRTKLFG